MAGVFGLESKPSRSLNFHTGQALIEKDFVVVAIWAMMSPLQNEFYGNLWFRFKLS